MSINRSHPYLPLYTEEQRGPSKVAVFLHITFNLVFVSVLAFGLAWLANMPFCNLMFRCGCQFATTVAEGTSQCNINNPSGPHCPFCAAPPTSAWLPVWFVISHFVGVLQASPFLPHFLVLLFSFFVYFPLAQPSRPWSQGFSSFIPNTKSPVNCSSDSKFHSLDYRGNLD